MLDRLSTGFGALLQRIFGSQNQRIIESMKNAEAQTGVTASRVNEIKTDVELLRKLEIDPEKLNPERDAEKIAAAVKKDPRLRLAAT